MKTVSVREFSVDRLKIIREVATTGEKVTILKHKKPYAEIIVATKDPKLSRIEPKQDNLATDEDDIPATGGGKFIPNHTTDRIQMYGCGCPRVTDVFICKTHNRA